MFNLAEYRNKPQSLADFLPWAALVADGVVLNKDGSLQRTARFRGPDLDSATPAELVGVTARLNNALRRLGTGWAIFVEASRHSARDYPASQFPDPVSSVVDAERAAQFEEEGAHFESAYYLTFVFLPPAEEAARAESFLYEGVVSGGGVDAHQILKGFIDRIDRVLQLIEGFVPEAAWLSDAETLTYLHSCISTRRHRVRVPEVPMYLDAILVDEPLVGGLAPRLGKAHLRTLSVMGFPSVTYPGILDDLNRLAIPYRWSTRSIALDKTDATRVLTRIRRQWFAKRKSVAAILKEVMTNEASVLLDTDAHNKALDADAALQELGSDLIGQVYVTATVTVWDEDARVAEERLQLVEKVIQGRDFTCIAETVNAVEAWLGSLPGGEVAFLASTLIVLDVTIAGLFWAWGADEDVLAHLIKKTLYVGFFAFLIGNFNGLAKIVFNSFSGLGLKAAGSGLTADQFLQPGRLAQVGIDAGRPILQAASSLLGYVSFFQNFVQIFVLLVAWLIVLVAFFILAIQLFVTLIEFKLTTLAGFVLVPFGLFGRTAFLAERVLGNVVASGVKVLVLAVIVGIGTTLFSEFTQGFGGNQPSLDDVLALVLAALALLGLGIFGPSIAAGLAAGAPQLGAGAVVGTALAAGGLGVAGAMGLRAGAGALVGAGRGIASLASGAGSSSGGAGGPPSGSGGPPAWARRLRREQLVSHGVSAAAHAVRSGDHGGGSAGVDLKGDR